MTKEVERLLTALQQRNEEIARLKQLLRSVSQASFAHPPEVLQGASNSAATTELAKEAGDGSAADAMSRRCTELIVSNAEKDKRIAQLLKQIDAFRFGESGTIERQLQAELIEVRAELSRERQRVLELHEQLASLRRAIAY
jgi:hypothetical protein